MRKVRKQIQRFWIRENSLSILLFILLIHMFVIIPFGQRSPLEKALFLVFYVSILSAGMIVMVRRKVLRNVAIVLLGILVLLGSGIILEKNTILQILNDTAVVIYCLLLGWVVLLRIFRRGRITIHRIQGAIVVYLLVGLMFAISYHLIILISTSIPFNGLDANTRRELMYFSLTTLTSTGYGDITPAVAATKSLANLESLIGQLYPAILITRLVSMEYEHSRKGRLP